MFPTKLKLISGSAREPASQVPDLEFVDRVLGALPLPLGKSHVKAES